MSTSSRRRFNRRTLLKASAVGAVPALIAIQRSALAPERSASAVLDAPIQTELFPELVAGNTNFALELFANVRQTESGNFLFSPYSVSQALAMTYAGATGETAAQMAKTLSYRLQQPELHEAFNSLNISLTGHGNAAAIPARGEVYRSFLIANALWGEQGYPFSRSYIEQIEHFYSAGFRQSDFINAAEEARQEINDWVAGQTEDRIQDIVPENALTSDTGLVLVNAIYFSGGWASTFEPRNTQEGAFFLLDGSTVPIPFMFRVARLPYSHGVGYQVIEFPYQA